MSNKKPDFAINLKLEEIEFRLDQIRMISGLAAGSDLLSDELLK